MVGSSRSTCAAAGLLAFAVVLLLLFALPQASLAQEAAEPTITEEYTVTVNQVGDARVVDTITYTDEDFEYVKNVEGDNRGFLTRRYKTDDNIGELVDFDVKLDDAENSVVITYDKPGFAYFTEGEWVIFGLPDETAKKQGGSYTFEEQSTVNSEFTLFTDQEILTTTTIELPSAASGHKHDPDTGAIRYSMPAARSMMGFWSDNRTVLSLLFGFCTALFAGLLLFVLTRTTLTPASAAPVTAPAAVPGAPVPPVPRATPPAADPVPPPVPGYLPAGFCGKCGRPLTEGKKYCPHCGAHR